MSNLGQIYYGSTAYSTWGDIKNSPITVASKKIDVFEEEPALRDWVLKSIEREQENERQGRVSPTFSSVAEMKKWHEEN